MTEKEVKADLPDTMRVKCLVSNVHLGNGKKLIDGEVAEIDYDIAMVLKESGSVRKMKTKA